MKKRFGRFPLLILFIAVLIFAGSCISSAEESSYLTGSCGQNCFWIFDGSTGKLSITGTESDKRVSRMSDFSDPSSAEQRPWIAAGVAIGSIRSVEVRYPVVSVGSYAFAGASNLKSVFLSDHVAEIGAGAFRGTGITAFSLPKMTEEIRAATFENCRKLQKVSFEGKKLKVIGDSAFRGCTALTEAHLAAVMCCIGENAFEGCTALTDLTLPQALTTWMPEGGSPVVPRIEKNAFMNCSGLTSVTLPLGTSFAGENAFKNCTSLIWVKIPDVETILNSENVFEGCPKDMMIIAPAEAQSYAFVSGLPEMLSRFRLVKMSDPAEDPLDISKCRLITGGNLVYNGKAQTPETYVVMPERGNTAGGTVLASSVCSLTWKNNTDAGTATVTAVPRRNSYAYGRLTATFTIEPLALTRANGVRTGTISAVQYTAKAQMPDPGVSVMLEGERYSLRSGTDYTLSYKNNVKAGTAAVTVRGKGNFQGSLNVSFVIRKTGLTKAAVSAINDRVWNGGAVRALPVVRLGSAKLVRDKDYTLSWKNNTSVGTASVIIKGTGSCTGSLTKTFRIIPKGTSLTALAAGKDFVKVSWKKQAKGTGGYTIQYSEDKTFAAGWKNVPVSGAGRTSGKVSGLKAGTRYYFRIRTWKKVNGVLYASAWSGAKSVKTKAA